MPILRVSGLTHDRAIETALAHVFDRRLQAWNLQEVLTLSTSFGVGLGANAILDHTTRVWCLAIAIVAFGLWWGTTLLVEFEWKSLFSVVLGL